MAVDNLEAPVVAPVTEGEANMVPQSFHYSSMMYLRAMLGILWSAISHPFSTSVIDLTTGRVYTVQEE